MKVIYKTKKGSYEMDPKLATLLTQILGYDEGTWGPYNMDMTDYWRGFFQALVLTGYDGACDFTARVCVFGGCRWEGVS